RYYALTWWVLLYFEQPLVRRSLEGYRAAPERLYLLLAALFGTINRALEPVTDDEEERWIAALLDHLVANPHLLATRGLDG
ncbi:MAG: hypothetical protein ACOX6T_15730, partial [Myxococcales bacterium]